MGKFQPAPIFSDYMVLQRGKNITVFGTGENGTEVTGELAGFRASSVVREGKWQLVFPPMGFARFMSLELSDGESDFFFENIVVGEVWIISGAYSRPEADDLVKNENDTAENGGNVSRYYSKNGWRTLDESEKTVCSAFAEKVSSIRDTPVGIIELDDENAEKTAPYTICGALYYRDNTQDIVTGQNYFYELTKQLLKMREIWHNDDLPIIIGQLPLLNDENDTACVVREAQMRAYRNLKNMGIAVLLDCADDEQTVGERFAAQALHLVYGGYDGAFSPIIHGAVWRSDVVELHFDNAFGGFKIDEEADGFEICGDDGVFHPAFADISGERIFLSSSEVSVPRGARYLWNNHTKNLIRNGFGLPLAPFRINID